MFLFLGLLCAGLASTAAVASETNAHKFQAFPHLTSQQSLDIIAKLRAIHPQLADFCNQDSRLKDKVKCDDMLVRLHCGKGFDKNNDNYTGVYALFDTLKITANTEACFKKYQDPIECNICIRNAEQELANAQKALESAVSNKNFKS